MVIAHSIADSLQHVRTRMAEAAQHAHRNPAEVTLVAVSKTYPAQAMLETMAVGQLDFGENRIEEALTKRAEIHQAISSSPLSAQSSPLRWHLIGHVQSRKAKDAAGQFDLIHSVDTLKLAEALDRRAAQQDSACIQHVLLECNVSGEASKSGFELSNWEHEPARLTAFVDEVKRMWALPHLRIDGLMTMAPIVEHAEQARPVFASLRCLRDALRDAIPSHDESPALLHLSMGMSDDFEVAIAEGSTLVRVGRAIFGERTTHLRTTLKDRAHARSFSVRFPANHSA